jgi:hypothetical protein
MKETTWGMRHRWEESIEMNDKEISVRVWAGFISSGHGLVAGPDDGGSTDV